MSNNELASWGELLSGHPDLERRAADLLALIEARCAYMCDESGRVAKAYFLGEDAGPGGEPGQSMRRFDVDYLLGLRWLTAADQPPTLADLERFAGEWRAMVPAGPEVRAALLWCMARAYPLAAGNAPRTLAALDAGSDSVQEAYRALYGGPPPLPAEPPFDARAPGGAGQVRTATAPPQPFADTHAALGWVELAGGNVLYSQGDPADALYVLVSGRLRATTQPPVETACDGDAGQAESPEHVVGEYGRGEMVGELEVLSGERRSLTVRAVRDSELVSLSRAELVRLASAHPEVMWHINRVIAHRLREEYTGDGRVHNTLVTFALLPLGGAGPAADFAHELTGALSAFGPALHLTAAMLDDALGPGAAQIEQDDEHDPQIVAWLNEREARYRFVLYQADPDLTPWTRRCIRQADRILLVARATSAPLPGNVERQVLDEHALRRAELVLLHSAAAEHAVGTRRWLDPRPGLLGHYHVRIGQGEDLERLARRLTGRALGLVLGGGGARGYAHIGVFRALREAGIDVDLVGGTSMGAILGAVFAMDMDYDRMLSLCRELSSPLKLFDPTLPAVSFFESRKVGRILRRLFGDSRIEDLWRPFFCVSSNLTHAVPTVHRQGPLWLTVRASMAIPGIFSPVLYGGDLLVDGCVLNNLPVDVMQGFTQGGPLVAVNVFPEVDLFRDYKFGPSVSGWQALYDKLNPFIRDLDPPLIFETLLRVLALNDVSQAKAKRRLTDLHICPPVDHFNILDFGAYARIIEIGYRSGQEAIAAWQARPEAGKVATEGGAIPAGQGERTLTKQLDRVLAELEALVERQRAAGETRS
jgi:predicted acylesterase/phospholipase RssA